MGVTAYVGLGSNMGRPGVTLRQALLDLDGLPSTRCVGWSPFYRNPPVGPQDQEWFVNAVATIDTGLSAWALLAWLQRIENRHGRRRTRHWGPRTLDLDLLLYGRSRLRTTRLEIPHPQIYQRAFVIWPLLGLNAALSVPGRGSLRSLGGRCSRHSLRRVSRHWPRPPACG